MDEAAYKEWWKLHIRVACGETLTAEEQAAYEAGERRLDAEEHLHSDVDTLRELKARMTALEAENAELRERKARLDAEIAQLVAQLNPQTRSLIDVGN